VVPADDLNGLACLSGCPHHDQHPHEYRVHVCFGPNCTERGSRALFAVLENAVHAAGLANDVEILATTCRNRCDEGPSLNVYPGPVFYNRVDSGAIHDIVGEHLAGGAVVTRWLYRPRIECQKRRRAG
jgi:(2Fe-2S) ferredoxin